MVQCDGIWNKSVGLEPSRGLVCAAEEVEGSWVREASLCLSISGKVQDKGQLMPGNWRIQRNLQGNGTSSIVHCHKGGTGVEEMAEFLCTSCMTAGQFTGFPPTHRSRWQLSVDGIWNLSSRELDQPQKPRCSLLYHLANLEKWDISRQSSIPWGTRHAVLKRPSVVQEPDASPLLFPSAYQILHSEPRYLQVFSHLFTQIKTRLQVGVSLNALTHHPNNIL